MIGQVGLLFACFTTVCYGVFWDPKYPNVCPPNQEYTDNYMATCERSCATPVLQTCSYLSHQSGCNCKNGYYRLNQGTMGACVTLDQCYAPPAPAPTPSCPPNQVFTTNYMPNCEQSCDIPYHNNCYYLSNQIGCTCKPGFYRKKQGSSGACVSYDQCYYKTPSLDISTICPDICYSYPYMYGNTNPVGSARSPLVGSARPR